MNHISITHNPFLVETEFRINGHSPSESSNINTYGSKRLQVWVEHIFDDLQALFNGSKDFFIEFTGLTNQFFLFKKFFFLTGLKHIRLCFAWLYLYFSIIFFP